MNLQVRDILYLRGLELFGTLGNFTSFAGVFLGLGGGGGGGGVESFP